MARNEEAVRSVCELSEEQEKILTGHQKPILLLDKKEGVSKLAKSVAPFNPKVGIMLPYAPVQLLLFQYDDGIQMPDFLVMTSGNISGKQKRNYHIYATAYFLMTGRSVSVQTIP